MRVAIDTFVSAMILVILATLGIVLGFKVGYRIDYPPLPPTAWVLLDSPVKFSEILESDAYEVLAQTTDGKVYYWAGPPWVEADEIVNDGMNLPPMTKRKTCSVDVEPPGKVVKCALKYVAGGGAPRAVEYALLEDGTIWEYAPQNSVSDTPILSFLVCPSIGLLLGVMTGAYFIDHRLKKRQASSFTLDFFLFTLPIPGFSSARTPEGLHLFYTGAIA